MAAVVVVGAEGSGGCADGLLISAFPPIIFCSISKIIFKIKKIQNMYTKKQTKLLLFFKLRISFAFFALN